MNKLKIGVKIGLGFGLVIITMALLVALVTYNIKQADSAVAKLNNIEMPIAVLANEYDTKTLEILVSRAYYLLDNNDKASLDMALNTFTPMTTNMMKQGNDLLKLASREEAGDFFQMMDGLDGKINGWRSILNNVVQATIDRQNTMSALTQEGVEIVQALQAYVKIVDDDFISHLKEFNPDPAETERLRHQTVLLRELLYGFSEVESSVFYAQYANNAQILRDSNKKFEQGDALVNELLPLTHLQVNKDRLSRLLELFTMYRQQLMQSADVIERINSLLEDCKAASSGLRQMFQSTTNASFEDMGRGAVSTAANINASEMIMFIAFAVALLLSIAVTISIIRTITRPVKVTTDALSAIANGDFTVAIPEEMLKRKDEMGNMLNDVNNMCQTLSSTVAAVISDSATVANAAGEISQGNQQLSEQTQQQAGAIEETASALEQMTSSVKQNADSSSSANQLAQKTSQLAQEGGTALNRTVEAMKQVTESSRKINDIINVVNEIAFQTNLLALNAAVEAARAGEAGRGFAVVAGEVRNLAGRSAQASKEIQDLITDSVNKIEQGNTLVAESGKILSEIISSVQTVADTIGEISSATHEQATGIEEVNKAVSQMDQAVQQNAAFVEQAASSSETMANVAAGMRDRMSQFKVRTISGNLSLPAPE